MPTSVQIGFAMPFWRILHSFFKKGSSQILFSTLPRCTLFSIDVELLLSPFHAQVIHYENWQVISTIWCILLGFEISKYRTSSQMYVRVCHSHRNYEIIENTWLFESWHNEQLLRRGVAATLNISSEGKDVIIFVWTFLFIRLLSFSSPQFSFFPVLVPLQLDVSYNMSSNTNLNFLLSKQNVSTIWHTLQGT